MGQSVSVEPLQELVAGEGDGHQVAYGRVFAQLRHRIVGIIIEVGVVLRFVAGVVPHGGVVIIGASVRYRERHFVEVDVFHQAFELAVHRIVSSANAIRASRIVGID